MEGLFKCPKFEVVCLGSWPSIMVCGFISLKGNIAGNQLKNWIVLLCLRIVVRHVCMMPSWAAAISWDSYSACVSQVCMRRVSMTSVLWTYLKASMTTFPLTLWMGSITTDTARGWSCSKLCTSETLLGVDGKSWFLKSSCLSAIASSVAERVVKESSKILAYVQSSCMVRCQNLCPPRKSSICVFTNCFCWTFLLWDLQTWGGRCSERIRA